MNFNYKCFILCGICISSLYYSVFPPYTTIQENNINIITNINHHNNKLIEENFFVFDSNNLENIIPHMYGFSVSQKGILTDN